MGSGPRGGSGMGGGGGGGTRALITRASSRRSISLLPANLPLLLLVVLAPSSSTATSPVESTAWHVSRIRESRHRVDAEATVCCCSPTQPLTSASKDPPPNTPYSVTASESHGASYVYAAPEIRLARRVGDRLELSAGLQLVVLAAVSSPSWTDQKEVHAGPVDHQGDGEGVFGKLALSGSFIFLVAPGVGARYAF